MSTVTQSGNLSVTLLVRFARGRKFDDAVIPQGFWLWTGARAHDQASLDAVYASVRARCFGTFGPGSYAFAFTGGIPFGEPTHGAGLIVSDDVNRVPLFFKDLVTDRWMRDFLKWSHLIGGLSTMLD